MGTAAKPTRQNRTITIDFRNRSTYFCLLEDGKAFVECVIAFLMSIGFQLTHKVTCRGGGCLTRHSHYARDLLPENWATEYVRVLSSRGGPSCGQAGFRRSRSSTSDRRLSGVSRLSVGCAVHTA